MKRILQKIFNRRNLVILGVVSSLYALVGFVAAPWLVKYYGPIYARKSLQCRLDMGKVRINPFLLTLDIDGFSLRQSNGAPLIAFGRLFVDFEMSSLFHWGVVLQKLELDKPDINVVIEPDGTTNFQKLAVTNTRSKESANKNLKPLALLVKEIRIHGGRFALVDRQQSMAADIVLENLRLNVKGLSTIKKHNGTIDFSATTNEGESVRLKGEIFLFPFRSTGRISFDAVRAASIWEFFRDHTNLDPPQGKISANAEYHFDFGTSPIRMTLDGLKVSLADLSLKLLHDEKAFLKVEKASAEVPLYDLVRDQLHLGKLQINKGFVDVHLDNSGGSNFQRIVRSSLPEDHTGGKRPSPASSSKGSALGAEKKPPSNPAAAQSPVDPLFKMNADTVEIKNVSLALNDESRNVPIKVRIAAARLNFKADMEVDSKGTKASLNDISSELKGIGLKTAKSPEPLFVTEKLTLEGGACDFGDHLFTASRLAMSGGHLDVRRTPDGKIDWQQIFGTKGTERDSTSSRTETKPVKPWKFLVKSFSVDGFGTQFSDLTTHSDQPVMSLQDIKAKFTGVDGKSPMQYTLGFRQELGVTATLNGTLNPSLPSVDAVIDLSGISLTSLQPYIEPYVTLKLESASVSAKGKLTYGVPGAGQKTAFDGSVNLDKLLLTDPDAQKTYLSWEALQIPEIKFTLQPNGLQAQDVKITKPVGDLIIEKDRTLNLAKVFRNRQNGKTPAPVSNVKKNDDQQGFPYQISRIEVDGGDMNFADLSLRPQFITHIHDITGEIMALSSKPNARARIRLDGDVDRYGIAKIRGIIQQKNFRRSSRLNMVFRNLDMKSLSPYSGKFAGRLIKSGKVSANLKYRIQDYKMEGDNNIVIQNLVLGKHVDEPGAADLPLDLAVALLEDSDGRIDIGLPVTGDLSDPQFSIGPLIGKLFTNLITKVVTSPFSVLGNMFGSDFNNFDIVEFDRGSAAILPPAKEKLLKLAEVLKKRPQLKIVIQGRYSPEFDGRTIKHLDIRTLIAAGLGNKPVAGEKPAPPDFTDSKTQEILEDLYKKRISKPSLKELEKGIESGTITPLVAVRHRGEKESNSKKSDGFQLYKLIPGAKSPEQAARWARELYMRLVENEKVPDKTFQQLARNRAQNIAEALEANDGFPKERISFKDPVSLSGEERPSAKLSLEAL